MIAIVLALGTSLAYGTSNLLGPRLSRRHPLGAVLLVGQLAALVLAVLLVLGSGESPPDARGVLLGIVAGAGNIWGLAGFYRAAQDMSISVVSALGGAAGTSLPVVWGIATGEALTALQITGIAVALGGGVLAAQSSEHAVVTASGVGWALLSSIGFGAFLIALPEAAESGTAWALLDARIAVVVFLVLGLLVLRAEFRAPVASTPYLAFPGMLLILGTLLYAEATQRGLLSVVAVLASLATVVTAALSFGFFHERLSRVQWAGVVLATIGVVLLAV